MNWKPIEKSIYRLSIVNCTMLAHSEEEKCKYCGRFGCTDRGFDVLAGDPPVLLREADLTQQVIEKMEGAIDRSGLRKCVRTMTMAEPQCVRMLKKSNAKALMEKLLECNHDCRRNDAPCPYRGEGSVCQRNVNPDDSPLVCLPDDDYYFDCPFHEQSFSQCYRRRDGRCTDLMEKFDATNKKDTLVLLAHRFSAAPCRFCNEGLCSNAASLHHGGACTLQGLMAPCEQYETIPSDHAYTEGVCTYIASKDGKDDCQVFPSSDYARGLNEQERKTLCYACRISHIVAKLTGLKCLGVRRTTSNLFLNQSNPLADHAIQINYLYLTHPGDVSKINPDLLAEAVFDGLIASCKGIPCPEYQSCHFNPI